MRGKGARAVAPNTPIVVGGDVNAANWSEVVSVADGAIVASSLKSSGKSFGKLDAEKIRTFVSSVQQHKAA